MSPPRARAHRVGHLPRCRYTHVTQADQDKRREAERGAQSVLRTVLSKLSMALQARYRTASHASLWPSHASRSAASCSAASCMASCRPPRRVLRARQSRAHRRCFSVAVHARRASGARL